MIRTRDLFVFLAVLCVVGVAISITYVMQTRDSFFSVAKLLLDTSSTSSHSLIATSSSVTINRSENIARLRSLLASQEITVTPSPSVEGEQNVPDTEVSPDGTESAEQEQTIVQRCGVEDDSVAVARLWPLRDVSVQIQEGDRVVIYKSVSENAPSTVTSTSTATGTPEMATTPAHTLLRMRAFPVKQSTPSCLPSDVVGVSLSGSLIYNADALRYSKTDAEQLLGYARDGFPIYGSYEGETDACGGYQHMSGYRYTISPNRSVVLNCYYNAPSTFVLP